MSHGALYALISRLKPAVHANEMREFYISATNNGSITWLAPVVTEVVCLYNVRYFPYDTQVCNLTIGSWLHSQSQIDLWNRNDEGETRYGW